MITLEYSHLCIAMMHKSLCLKSGEEYVRMPHEDSGWQALAIKLIIADHEYFNETNPIESVEYTDYHTIKFNFKGSREEMDEWQNSRHQAIKEVYNKFKRK